MNGPYFASVFGRVAHLDGLVLKFRTQDAEHRQHIIMRLDKYLDAIRETDTKEHSRLYKVKLFRMDNTNTAAILKVSYFGKYLDIVKYMPAALLSYVDEAHFKAYIVNQDEKVFRAFTTESVLAAGGRQPTAFGQHRNPNSTKGAGYGMRIGDRNSDYNFVFYQRRGQRIGLELRIADKAAKRRTMAALESAAVYNGSDADTWANALETLAMSAADEFVKDTLQRGVGTDWFNGITDVKEAHLAGPEYQYTFKSLRTGAATPPRKAPLWDALDDGAE